MLAEPAVADRTIRLFNIDILLRLARLNIFSFPRSRVGMQTFRKNTVRYEFP